MAKGSGYACTVVGLGFRTQATTSMKCGVSFTAGCSLRLGQHRARPVPELVTMIMWQPNSVNNILHNNILGGDALKGMCGRL